MKLAIWGFGFAAALAALGWAVWGRSALLPIAAFGLLATAIQLTAVAALRPALGAPLPVLVRRWGLGMALRLGGVVLFAVAVMVDRELFQPLPSALGYLGVVVPLLFMEMRFLK